MGNLREAWNNAFYRGTVCYVATLVTIIFALQIYRFFIDLPSEAVVCPPRVSNASLIPVIGVFFDAGP